jgi:hypothetical protein
LRDLIRAAVKVLVAEPRTVEEAVDDGDTMVPWFDEVVSSGESSHRQLEFIQIGWVGELISEGWGGIEQLAITNGTVRGVEIRGGEELDGEVGAAGIMEFCPAASGNLRAEAKRVHVIAGERAVTFVG